MLNLLQKEVNDQFLVVGVDVGPRHAKQLENLQIFFLCKLLGIPLVIEAAGEVLDDILIDKISSEKLVVLQQFLQHRQLTGHILCNDILKNELEPF